MASPDPLLRNGSTGAMVWTLTIRVYSQPEAMRTLRKLVNSAARSVGASEADAFDLEVAVGESVTNAYVHAYGEKTRGRIDVDLGYDGEDFHMSIHNSGRPVTGKITVPTDLPGGKSGRGLYLIGKLMDQVEIVHPFKHGRGTAVRMVKHLHK